MAPSNKPSGNSGSKNPHMTKRNRFNSNTNVPVSHAGCQVAIRSKLDREKHFQNKTARVIVYTSRANGIFHV